jgi:hypothetical protein
MKPSFSKLIEQFGNFGRCDNNLFTNLFEIEQKSKVLSEFDLKIINPKQLSNHDETLYSTWIKIEGKFFEYLEYYSILSLQPISCDKTEAPWTARAIVNPKFDIHMGEHKIAWVKNVRYLGYHLSCKLDWNYMISIYKTKICQRVAIIKSCKMYDSSSAKCRRTLFSAYVRPLFTWLFCIFPLLTEFQRDDLSHFYMTCLKRTLHMHYLQGENS